LFDCLMFVSFSHAFFSHPCRIPQTLSWLVCSSTTCAMSRLAKKRKSLTHTSCFYSNRIIFILSIPHGCIAH
jgi:hypothetical protein